MAENETFILQQPQQVEAYLRRKGWVAENEQLYIEALSGGVSNQVWKIEGTSISWVMKQALPKLKVQEDWYADVRRIENESAAMRMFNQNLSERSVPEVLHHDQQNHIFVMACAPIGSITWKEELLQGRFDPEIARRAGSLLQRIHGQSALLEREIRKSFDDLSFLTQLRLEPYHHFIAKRYPELKAAIDLLLFQLTDQRSCIVHGDFSPKNIMIAPDRSLILLDFEVVHWGNPVFDVSFCVSHLMLKGFALAQEEHSVLAIQALLSAYESNALSLLPHLGLLLLARIDGTSTVEYVKDELTKQRIRAVGMKWLGIDPLKKMELHQIMSEITFEMKGS